MAKELKLLTREAVHLPQMGVGCVVVEVKLLGESVEEFGEYRQRRLVDEAEELAKEMAEKLTKEMAEQLAVELDVKLVGEVIQTSILAKTGCQIGSSTREAWNGCWHTTKCRCCNDSTTTGSEVSPS
ncbi:hypothetical protein SPBR_07992 [Sporothrix brasiliensis 5110]|uniref:Uncharacterized protein n=1 Tax=Sporothrix brasiliensis 5110 TaxID=1398154 RepID=A0A0C2IU96_9PEZI|nr:uncharacterized protein SPBR_07992 [Sporothrix brasiliensis 5110]KIH88577.1 hypothetical protein SPBR_07992 [Sporothrix brasiliensis 5110]